MEHQPNEHGSHGGPHLPDPSIWPLVVGVAALFLGAALIFWSRDTSNDFAGPLLGAAIVATLVAAFGWAYEDGRMKRKAEQEHARDGREARYTQVVTFAIAEGQVETARGKSGIISRIEGSDSALRDLDGFQDLRIILSPATTGPSQVLVETTWSDREGLATYEQTRRTMLDMLASHPEEVVPGSVQVFDMEVVRDTKDVSFRFGAGAAFTVIAGLLVGGFMVGAGLSLFQEEGTGGGGGVAPTPVPENPFRVVATDNKFDKAEITAGPNAEITITLVNNGQAKHNIHFTDKAGGTTLAAGAQGEIIDGGGTETKVTFTTPGVGEYYFLCDLHPAEMNGTFKVVEGGPTGTGETQNGGGGEVPGATQVIAGDNFFDLKVIKAKAGEPFTVTLTNEGKALHNIHFFDKKGGSTLVEGAQGQIIKGGETDTITFTVPNPGTYYFHCDIHPVEMTGDFIVE